MSVPGAGAVDVDALVQRIREQVQLRKAQLEAGERQGAASSRVVLPTLPRLPSGNGQIVQKESYELQEFLVFRDEEFVRNAYLGLLGREPDAHGLAHFTDTLRSGQLSTVELLGRLRYSPEGRARNVKVRGLTARLILRTAMRLPVLAQLTSLLASRRNQRRLDQLEALIGQLINEQGRRINPVIDSIEQALKRVARRVDDSNRLEQLTRRVDELAISTMSLTQDAVDAPGRRASPRELTAQTGDLLRRMGEVERTLTEMRRDLDADSASRIGEAARLDKALTELTGQMGNVESSLSNAVAALREQLVPYAPVPGQVADLRLALLDQQRRIGYLLEELRRYHEQPSGALAQAVESEHEHQFDAFYASFEDRFRGTREEIKERASVYLEYVKAAGAGSPETPILDLGCGRGEWLELLREQGLAAKGVDLNRVMIAQCREQGLVVEEGDALALLRALPARSLGAVSGFHIIEHLPFAVRIALLDETLRVLKPGGVAIFETPNPENMVVGACNFYYDPTHQQPLPPEPTQFLFEARGFVRVSIVRQRPDEQTAAGLPRQLAQWFGSARDYAVVAHRP